MSSMIPPAAVRGTWEELFQRADGLAENKNDDAIPIFRKIVNRIGRMPQKRRQASGGRLQEMWMRAAVGLHFYLTLRDRYDEALAVIDALLRGETVSSERFAMVDARISPIPAEPVEWWLGAGTPTALDRLHRRLTGR